MIHLKLQNPKQGEEEFAVLLLENKIDNIKNNESLFAEVSKREEVTIRKFINRGWRLGPEEKISSKDFCLTWQGD